MELKDLIKKYYDSNDKTEKSELRTELPRWHKRPARECN